MKNYPFLKSVSRETIEKLEIYISLLQQWNKKINLVSQQGMDQVWKRHVYDSFQLIRYLDSSVKSIADLGSGGGFPGLILALSTDIPVILIESDMRKTIFLREVLRQTKTQATVLCQRIENVNAISADVVTARALTSLTQLLKFSKNILNKNGYCLFLKGRSVNLEIEEAQKNWKINYKTFSSQTNADGVIVKINQFERVE
ncbi:16S rRNA (guanine(527)-N(7))-methyltransferase RsmG [Commensalibacter sp. M0391]|nr:16S rRNA (guanine(527)-N(7))-methyltransferase RsmG [Commensalibacter melissae]MBI0017282.1 16S rRNA (guanine(527)-N(7))-methyltransferase RsmG [Commensalibacter sp. B14384M2]MBI0018996.1 16S rRNA (guanine(527)-N(7))-methyltransferase RsmG [Commensalibacter sp. W8133]MBI0049422.1 16S rRNA (guanine(527)-N(7))-methyltransferase RsmG [Commensalibacter sp. B14384M3]MBI0066280.1 16S rRNA (guanine(527)-N(7))-methyltransferase RsmG [Commensalibacter sp. M0134]MBI0070163.1 16S rRNA (guanine(527)-N(